MEAPTDSLVSFLESESLYTLPNLEALLIRTTDAATMTTTTATMINTATMASTTTMASTVDTSSGTDNVEHATTFLNNKGHICLLYNRSPEEQ